jgi:hypothetical protein
LAGPYPIRVGPLGRTLGDAGSMSRFTIETLVALLLFGVLAGLLILLAKRMKGTRWVTVGERVPMTVRATDVPRHLAALGHGRVVTPTPECTAVVLSRTPVWVIAPIMLLFPLGLLLLRVREDVSLEVAADPSGTAWLSGRTEAKTLTAIRNALVGA